MVQAELKKALRGIKDESVSVPVKPEVEQKPSVWANLKAQIRAMASKLSLPIDPDLNTALLRAKLRAAIAVAEAGERFRVKAEPDLFDYQREIRAALSRSKITHKVNVDVDVDNRSITNTAARAGRGFAGSFRGGFISLLMNPFIGIPVAIAAAFALPALGAAVAAVTLAGGGLAALFIGAFLLRADPEIKAAFDGLFESVKKGMTEAVKPLKGPLLEALKILREALKDIAPDVRAFFKTIAKSGGIQELARGLGGLIRQLADTGAIDKFAKAFGPAMTQLGMALPDIGNAFAQFLISISKPDTIKAVGDTFRFVADVIRFLGDVLASLSTAFQTAKAILKGIGEFFSLVGEGIPVIWGLVTADIDMYKMLGDELARIWRDLWNGMTSEVTNAASGIGTAVKQIPAQIVDAIGDTASLLLQPGRNIVDGLIAGIKSRLGPLAGIASTMAGTIRKFLPFSPAKEGPLSGKGNPYNSGQIIATDLAAGVTSKLPGVSSAASQLAGMFGGSSASSGAAAAAGGPKLTIDSAGSRLDQVILEIIRIAIANGFGGDVDLAIGHGRG